jgi:hypothetical protein
MSISLDEQDQSTILAYFRQTQRENGYNGFVCINVDRLAEIHMHCAELTVKAYLARARLFQAEIKEQELLKRKIALENELLRRNNGDVS